MKSSLTFNPTVTKKIKIILKFFYFRKLALFFGLAFVFNYIAPSLAVITPPNYNFSLDTFADFAPGADLEGLKTKYGKSFFMNEDGGIKTYKFYVSHIRYKFPVIVQTTNGKVIDFFALLPTYFLHDVFHQSLINRIGKQDRYKKIEENALYIWNSKNGIKHIYSGTCTITCFPLYYSQIPDQIPPQTNNFKPLIEQYLKIETKGVL